MAADVDTAAPALLAAAFAAGSQPRAISRLTDGTMLAANDAFHALLGFEPPELLGRSSFELGLWPDPQRRSELVETLRRMGFLRDISLELRNRCGEMLAMRLSVSTLDADHILVELRDPVAEAMEQFQNQRLRAVVETSPDGFWIAGEGGRLLETNDAYVRMSGYSRDELLDMRIPDLELREQSEETAAHIERIMLNGYDRFETEHRTKEGQVLELEVTTTYWASGNCFLAFLRDISQRKVLERQAQQFTAELEGRVMERTAELFSVNATLAGANRQLRMQAAALEAVANAVAVCDRDGIVRWANPAFARISGYAPQEFLGRSLDLLDSGELPEQRAQMWQCARAGVIWTGELINRRKDGSLYHEAHTITPMFEAGGMSGFVAVGIDVSRLKAAEEQRLQLERQLMQAQKMEAIGQLTGGIAHDFNNILASILGYDALALRHLGDGDPTRMQHYLEAIAKSGERARDLVAKMLAYTRQQPSGVAVPIEVGAAVRDVVRLLEPLIPAGITLHLSGESESSAIRIVPVELQQVLMNLVINARDAIGETGEIAIVLRRARGHGQSCLLCHSPIHGELVEIVVSDSGSGIAPEHLHRIFDPFFTTKAPGKGSGLGLSMVFGVVRQADGHLTLETGVGQGTRFHLLFPALTPVAAAQPAREAGVAARSGGRIWLVDDETAIVEYLTDLLQEERYEVVAFSDPLSAVAAYRRQPQAVDLLITDQTMPGMSGMELMRAMRAIRPLPIILCSGYSEHVDDENAADQGVDRFLRKPVSPEVLLAAVAELLAGKEE